MTKQTFELNNCGDQDATTDIVIALAVLGFDVKCVMHESVSMIRAEREMADNETFDAQHPESGC
jgi:hypothetical protein